MEQATTEEQTMKGTTYYTDGNTGMTLATVHYQGGWRVKLHTGPSECVRRTFATEEAARNTAARHAASFA